MLGDALSRMKIIPAKRQVMQTIAGTFRGNALKFKWHLVSSPACSLCNHANESQVHIQCVCPALKGERIRGTAVRPGPTRTLPCNTHRGAGTRLLLEAGLTFGATRPCHDYAAQGSADVRYEAVDPEERQFGPARLGYYRAIRTGGAGTRLLLEAGLTFGATKGL